MDSLLTIAQLIKANDEFAIVAHVSPDGDTLGCVLALAHALKRMGKRIEAVCASPVPHIYEFLPGAKDILSPGEAKPARVVIAVDCADEARMDVARPLFQGAQHTVNIDHHMTNNSYAQFNHVDGHAAATGELIYKLILQLGEIPDADEASCLYAALMSDTGNFAYSNTTPDTLRIAAELMELGADNTEINRRIYRTIPLQKQKLLGLALTKLSLHEDGKIGVSRISRADIVSCGASDEDAEGIIDHIRDIEGVEIALTVREADAGVYKVSLRSKAYADVGAIAKRMGGGGHMCASGYTAYGAVMDEAADAALSLAGEALRA